MEKKRSDCPCLPPGWKKEAVIRKSGLSAGKSDVYYYSPSGKKFRSKPQLARYLGNSIDLNSFDFRTGMMMPNKLQRTKQRLRNEAINQSKGKLDLNTTLPIRQTASIFKQPVTKVTDHPNNKVRSELQRITEQPQQLFWEKRLQGLSACDIAEQIIKSMELPKGLQGIGPGHTNEALLSAIASALHTSSGPITGQLSAAVEKNPAVWLNIYQPLCKQTWTILDWQVGSIHAKKVPDIDQQERIKPSPLDLQWENDSSSFVQNGPVSSFLNVQYSGNRFVLADLS
ncbi:LOW QUALITY PROTEIN: methyl-CpG-binding domain protein 2-like [Scyliorhinus canicula]|uniref:LOW QUALITY PROTEIN: methyl-CpG-binding domain protein 2-like n=1 Tax=Scyliorhinus canicula TaxID=7830 RepID=UPI0018F6E8DD|nr:LOW QUALITY PROTEIN: methyl-CpG-binding domain protein 2-like [Scyliorhinus canicula]